MNVFKPLTEGSSRRQAGVIPAPLKVEAGEGSFRLRPDTRIIVCDESLRVVAVNLAGFLSRATGYEMKVVAGGAPTQHAIILRCAERETPDEAYDLLVSSEQVVISSTSVSGAFYATQTLRQLLPTAIEAREPVTGVDWVVSGVRISDAPEYAYRGMHLDVSRHFFPVSFVKQFIDWMALHKLNFFHWHLTDDQGWRIEIKKYPRLTSVGAWRSGTVMGHTLGRDAQVDGVRHGGCYTQDEIRDVVRYAQDRCITIIPEIDMPGHSSALLASYPEYGCRDGEYEVATHFGIFQDVLCPSESTFTMLKDILTEVASLFPGPYIHIGGDEALTTQWEHNATCKEVMAEQGLADVQELQQYFVARLDRIVRSIDRRTIAWDDILEGSRQSKMTVVAWRGEQRAIDAAREGHDVIVSPSAYYFDFFQSDAVDEPLAIHGLNWLKDIYEYDFMPEALEARHRKNILGAQAALWTEYMATEAAAEYMLLPRMCAFAEQVWSRSSERSWKNFVQRLRGHYRRLDSMGVRASRSVYNVRTITSLLPDNSLQVVLRSDGDNHSIRYTLDGSAPSLDSPLYEGPLVLSESVTLRTSAEDRTDGALYGDSRLRFVKHKALGCPVTFAHKPEGSWEGDPAKVIVDGISMIDGFFLHKDWAGFHGEDLDTTIDFGVTTRIGEVSVGFAAERHRRLYPPTAMHVYVSLDKHEWRRVAALDGIEVDTRQRELSVTFERTSVRFVRVVCENNARVYSHESRSMEAVSLYIDEIVVL
ncbi:MAG: family 20 glycosylhydrolase [Gammaproteobacteria bacterium]|nr:family 20 glycosylhydrolase [Gammaproteobacteria bacterium]